MKGAQSEEIFRLSDFFGVITFFNFCFFLVLWGYGWRTANTSSLPDVTLSWLLATNDTMRLFYALWIGVYTVLCCIISFIVAHDPILNPNKHTIQAYQSNLMVYVLFFQRLHIFHLLDTIYGFFTVMKVLGLYGVLYWVVTDPDDTVRTLHYVSAAVAFGSAVALTWIMVLKRIFYYDICGITHHSPISLSKELFQNRGANLNIHDYINALNIVYAIIESGIAIGFTIDSFQTGYIQNYGYIEFILSLFIVLDTAWQMHESSFVDVDLEFVEDEDLVASSTFTVPRSVARKINSDPESINPRRKIVKIVNSENDDKKK